MMKYSETSLFSVYSRYRPGVSAIPPADSLLRALYMRGNKEQDLQRGLGLWQMFDPHRRTTDAGGDTGIPVDIRRKKKKSGVGVTERQALRCKDGQGVTQCAHQHVLGYLAGHGCFPFQLIPVIALLIAFKYTECTQPWTVVPVCTHKHTHTKTYIHE